MPLSGLLPLPPPSPSLPGTAPLPVPPTQAAAAAAPTARFQEKRDTILAAAAALFNTQGIKGATLADIATQVGLVTTSITYYYRRKEDLATACFLQAITAHQGLAQQAAAEATVVARVQRFFELQAHWLAAIASGAQPALILFNDIRALPDAQATTVYTAYNSLFRQVRALLAGPETAGLAREDLNARGHVLLSVALALRVWIVRHEPDEYPRVAQRVADLLLHGLAGAGQHWPGDSALASLGLHEPQQAASSAALASAPPAAAPAGSDETADAFLRAATELVNEQGYPGASVDKISARLHVTKGSFYHHNETKFDLIAACFERSFAVLRQVLKAAEAAPGSGWQRSCAAAAQLVRFQLSERGPLLRSTATSALPDQAHREQVSRTQQRLAERIAVVLVDGLIDRSVRPQDMAMAARVLASVIDAAAELRRWVPGVNPDNAGWLYARPALLGLLCSA